MLKPTSRQFNQTVFDHFEIIRENAVIAYSDAHLDDLRPSKEEYRIEDLELMEKYTDDLYIYYNHDKKNWDYFRATPSEAYKDRDYEANDKALANPFDFRSLVADIEDFPGKEKICIMMDNFMQTPISAFGLPSFSDEYPANANILQKVMPGYSPEMGIGSFLKSMQPYMSKLLGDYQEFDELRKNITSYIDTNEIKYETWGFAFNDQLEKTVIGKKFTDLLRQLSAANDVQDYWRQFQQAYSMLEMLGITEERTSRKRKRNNLSDLSKDCAHVFNAMSCDYFITNDKGLLVKAQILYHIFQVSHTKIVKLDELNQFSLSRPIDKSLDKLVPALAEIPFAFPEGKDVVSVVLEDSFLHYFDLASRRKTDESVYILSASKDEAKNFIYREILKVCDKITTLFGEDGYGRGVVELDEIIVSNGLTCLRAWNFQDAYFHLMCDSTERSFFILITFKS
ncbi:hypothetical protein ACWKWU_13500 [Chitinophaga lutea]